MIIDNRVLFIHIPHTGGRFVSATINKNHNCVHHSFMREVEGIEIEHLNILQNNSLYASSKMFKTFTIVRNPIDRFIGCLRHCSRVNSKSIQYMFENEINFFNTVNKLRINKTSNFFEPQINFIEKDTLVWKFEDRFNEEFKKFLLNNLNIKFETLKDIGLETHKKENDYNYVFDLNEKQKQYIKDYYFLDYIIFNY